MKNPYVKNLVEMFDKLINEEFKRIKVETEAK